MLPSCILQVREGGRPTREALESRIQNPGRPKNLDGRNVEFFAPCHAGEQIKGRHGGSSCSLSPEQLTAVILHKR